MDKCCLNCKYCFRDPSVDDIECGIPDAEGEWVHRESEWYYSPANDYCTLWEEEIEEPDMIWE